MGYRYFVLFGADGCGGGDRGGHRFSVDRLEAVKRQFKFQNIRIVQIQTSEPVGMFGTNIYSTLSVQIKRDCTNSSFCLHFVADDVFYPSKCLLTIPICLPTPVYILMNSMTL